jgi:hypothetical protein
MDRLVSLVQRLVIGEQRRLARRAQLEASEPGLRRFARTLSTTRGSGRVVLGRVQKADGRWGWVGLPTDDFISQHGLVSAATGSGKTFWLLGALLQVLRDQRAVVVFDAKGETAKLLLDVLIPALVSSRAGEKFLERLTVIRPFDSRFTPELNLTRREPDTPPIIQAYTIATAIEEGLGEEMGGRMHHLFVRCAALCVELGRPLSIILSWLRNPVCFARDAAHSSDETLREYARTAFPRENRASIEATAARLDGFFLMVGETLSTQRCVDFRKSLETRGGLTVVDTGNPPLGCERVAKFWSAALLGMIGRAILSRPVGPETPPAWFVAEEIQEGLTGAQATLLGRLLATARFRKVGVLISGQSRSQLASVDPALVQALRTNVGLQLQGRCSLEDATAFAHALPTPRGEGRPAEARQALINALTRLPRRSAYLWVRSAGLEAQLIRTPRLDLDPFRKAAEELPENIRLQIRQGNAAVPRPGKDVADNRPSIEEEIESTVAKPRQTDEPSDPEFPNLG